MTTTTHRNAHRLQPVRPGVDVNEFTCDPAYHRIMGSSVSQGLHTSAWADPGPGVNVERAAGFMLVSQVEAGHGRPVSTRAVRTGGRTPPWRKGTARTEPGP